MSETRERAVAATTRPRTQPLVGEKMLVSEWYHPPIWLTLGSVVVVLGASVLISMWATRNDPPIDPEGLVEFQDDVDRTAQGPAGTA